MAVICLSLASLAGAQPAGGRRARLDSAVLAAVNEGESIPVIVQVDSRRNAEVRQRLAGRGIAVGRDFSSVGGFGTDLSAQEIELVRNWDGVLGISFDAPVVAAGTGQQKPKKSATSRTATSTATTTTSSTSTSSTISTDWWTTAMAQFEGSLDQWKVLRGSLGLTATWHTGAGVGVAVVDSGIDGASPAFAGRIAAFYDFTRGGVPATPTDEYGHGTHVAGLIGSAHLTYPGIAPLVRFVGIKVLNGQGTGRTSDLLAALDFLIANHRQLGVQIVNLSLGHPIFEPAATDPLVQTVERAVRAGLVVVVSAGNHGQNPMTGASGYAGITSPGNAPSAITVGSLDLKGTADRRDDTVSAFSSRGPTWFDGLAKPDLLAPGHGLFSAAARNSTLSPSATGSATKMFGTSMAAATTTGVVALMMEASRKAFPLAERRLPPAAIKAMLQYTAVAVNDPGLGVEYDLLTQGAGGLNAAGALALAQRLDVDRAIGAWWLATGVTESSTLAGVAMPWVRRLIWGTTLLYGQAVYANAPAWQNQVVWGDTLIWGESFTGEALVWGDTIVWAENVVLANTLIWGEALVWGEGLVTFNGQTIVWSDTLIWGETLIWGDTLIWGEIATPPPASPRP